jgi:hypothetical protein
MFNILLSVLFDCLQGGPAFEVLLQKKISANAGENLTIEN